MSTSIVNILKKLPAFWLRIFSGWYPAVKVAGETHIHPLQMDVFAHNPFPVRQNRELALKNWIVKLEKPPP